MKIPYSSGWYAVLSLVGLALLWLYILYPKQVTDSIDYDHATPNAAPNTEQNSAQNLKTQSRLKPHEIDQPPHTVVIKDESDQSQLHEDDNVSVEEVLDRMPSVLNSHEPEERLTAMEVVADINHPAVLALAINALLDDDARVRIMAIEAVAAQRIGYQGMFIEPLLHDENKDVRIAAIEALADMENDQAVYALTGLLGDGDVSIRQATVNALGEIGSENIRPYLQQQLYDHDLVVRKNVTTILQETSVENGY